MHRYISSQKWGSESILCTSWWDKNLKKSTIQMLWEHWFYILIIKTNNATFFFTKNWFVNFSEYIWVFADFFLIFENPVYRKNVESYLARLSRNFSSIVRSLFEKTYSNFSTFDRSFKTKKKFRRLERIHVFGQIKIQFWLKKSWVTGFFDEFYFTNLLITFWNY